MGYLPELGRHFISWGTAAIRHGEFTYRVHMFYGCACLKMHFLELCTIIDIILLFCKARLFFHKPQFGVLDECTK